MRTQDVKDILQFLHTTKKLESVERYKASLKSPQNTVAEHSWRLGVMAYIIGSTCKVDVNMGRALELAIFHDLAEAKTGDIDAYTQIMAGKKMLEDKSREEETAMREMTDDVPFGDEVYALWKEYEDQETREAKFIKALDKIEGFLHIAEGQVGNYLPKEFHADYATKAVVAFDEATDKFPELKTLLDAVKEDLRAQFTKAGVAWIDS